MTERTFRIILGAILLAALYFDWRLVIYGYIVVLIFEGITNWRIPILVSRLQGNPDAGSACAMSPGDQARINFEAERALRLVVAAFLVVSYILFNKELWFFPWFIGFALFGAGLSGICPMVMGFRWVGFR
jgi:TctA family transporter